LIGNLVNIHSPNHKYAKKVGFKQTLDGYTNSAAGSRTIKSASQNKINVKKVKLFVLNIQFFEKTTETYLTRLRVLLGDVAVVFVFFIALVFTGPGLLSLTAFLARVRFTGDGLFFKDTLAVRVRLAEVSAFAAVTLAPLVGLPGFSAFSRTLPLVRFTGLALAGVSALAALPLRLGGLEASAFAAPLGLVGDDVTGEEFTGLLTTFPPRVRLAGVATKGSVDSVFVPRVLAVAVGVLALVSFGDSGAFDLTLAALVVLVFFEGEGLDFGSTLQQIKIFLGKCLRRKRHLQLARR